MGIRPDYDFNYAWKGTGNYNYTSGSTVSGGDWAYDYAASGWQQYAGIWGWTNKVAAQFPLKQNGSFESNGKVIDSISITDLPADWKWSWSGSGWNVNESCAFRYDATTYSSLYVCGLTYGYNGQQYKQSYVGYFRYAGDVTYFSQGHSDYWSTSGGGGSWAWNYSGRWVGGRRVALGPSVQGSFMDQGTTYEASAPITMQPINWDGAWPWTCTDYKSSSWSYHYCSQGSYKYKGHDRGCISISAVSVRGGIADGSGRDGLHSSYIEWPCPDPWTV